MYLLDNCNALIAAHRLRQGMALDFYTTHDGRYVSAPRPELLLMAHCCWPR
jgi:hypothetical protein